jgi:hypothetical protein
MARERDYAPRKQRKSNYMKIEKPQDTSIFPAGLHRFAALKSAGMKSAKRQAILATIPSVRAVTRSLYTGTHILVLAKDAEAHNLPTVDFCHFTV